MEQNFESGTNILEDYDKERRSKQRSRANPCLQRIWNLFFKKEKSLDRTNEKLLELLKPTRYKPITVDQMAKDTNFTKEEVKSLYRAFKQECPTAILDEETFREVFQKIFPLGESSKYAKLVFNTIDRDCTGGITFGDYFSLLSTLSKGSDQEKIAWSFRFYDVNKDGIISRDEMMKVTDSIYDLVGAEIPTKVKTQNVERVFATMDLDKDGVISFEEFSHYCTHSDKVLDGLRFLP